MVDPRISMVINITAPDYRGDNSSALNASKKTLRPLKKPRYGEG
jgi:hypothetical protein